eukprot:1691611-Rhodomonas_salina.2
MPGAGMVLRSVMLRGERTYVSGTEMAYGGAGTGPAIKAAAEGLVGGRAAYAVSGTDLAYAATSCSVFCY